MPASEALSSPTLTWKELYVAALMETNDEKMSARIGEAESAMFRRAKELFEDSGDNIQEKEALNDGFYALQALRSCLEIYGRLAVKPESRKGSL